MKVAVSEIAKVQLTILSRSESKKVSSPVGYYRMVIRVDRVKLIEERGT